MVQLCLVVVFLLVLYTTVFCVLCILLNLCLTTLCFQDDPESASKRWAGGNGPSSQADVVHPAAREVSFDNFSFMNDN